MKDIEVNGAHITDESAEILKQWQVKTEPVSACYIRVIEETIDDLTDINFNIPAEKAAVGFKSQVRVCLCRGGSRHSFLCPFRRCPFFPPLQ